MRSTNYFLATQAEDRFHIQQVCRTVMETFSTQFSVCLNARIEYFNLVKKRKYSSLAGLSFY